MDSNEIKRKALELAASVNAQIEEARLELAQQMVDKGQNPKDYKICDNMLDIVEGVTLQYKCWSIKKPNTKPKTKRGSRKNV